MAISMTPAISVARSSDQYDEGARRPADLEPAAAERRDDQPADDRGEQALRGRHPRSNRDRHRQGKRNDRNSQAGNRVGLQLRRAIALAKHGDEFRGE
jgi:hypothetical protein